MANNNIQPTHENIHSGLSGLKNDEKWADMLNFRCSDKRTTVVPHKFRLVRGRFHTLLAGLNGHNFAIGAEESIGFVGAEELCTYPLWRLQQRFLGAPSSRDSQSERLIVQGQYTGDRPVKLRVCYVEGKLIPDWVEQPTPTVEPELVLPVYCDLGAGDCNGNSSFYSVSGTITDSATSDPIPGVTVSFSRFGFTQFTTVTDAAGHFSFNTFYSGYYTMSLQHSAFDLYNEDLLVPGEIVLDRTLVANPIEPFNLHSFLTTANYDLSAFFVDPVVPPWATEFYRWRLHTDDCGSELEYYVGGFNTDGTMNTDPIGTPLVSTAYFDVPTKSFVSGYGYPEGMYFQIGVLTDPLNELTVTWPARSCIAGGDGS